MIDVPDIAPLPGCAEQLFIMPGKFHTSVQKLLRIFPINSDGDHRIKIEARGFRRGRINAYAAASGKEKHSCEKIQETDFWKRAVHSTSMIQVVNRSGFVYNKRNISAHGTSPFSKHVRLRNIFARRTRLL